MENRLRSLLRLCFPEWGDTFHQHRRWHNTPPLFTVAALAGEELVGHLAVVVRTITTTWNWRYNVASIQGVCVLPERRKEHIGTALMRQALEEVKRRGFLFAILFCKEPLVPYYSAQGWRLADDSMVMWNNRDLPIAMRSNCPMYMELSSTPFPEGPLDIHSPTWGP